MLVSACLALALFACDEPEPRARAQAQPEASEPRAAPAPSAEAEEPGLEPIVVTPPSSPRPRNLGGGGAEPVDDAVPSPEPGESLAVCLERCGSADLSPDNRATCRLLCESYHGPKTSQSNAALVSRFFGCFDQCESASCQVDCAGDAGPTPCKRGCLETLARCLPACAGGGSEGVCSERCETAARRCLGAC